MPNLLLDYRDVSGNDSYGYTVRFRPWSGVYNGYIDSSSAGIGVGTCQFALPTVPASLPNYVFAIVGFEFRFLGGERSIKKIGISENNGVATMTLNDPGDGDGFSWALRYAYVPANLFTNTNVVRSGNISGATEHRRHSSGIPRPERFQLSNDERRQEHQDDRRVPE